MTDDRRRVPVRLLLASAGAVGVAVQAMLVRELMSVLAGDELVAALVLAGWLAGESAGAFGAARLSVPRTGAALYPLALASVLPGIAALPAVALLRPALGLLPGEAVPLPGIALAALVLSMLPAAGHSALFVAASNCLRGPDAPGRAYLWRGIGTGVGGLLVYLVLIGRLPGAAVVAVCAAPLLVALSLGGRWPAAAILPLLAAVVVLGRTMEIGVAAAAWPGHAIVSLRDSRYGRILTLGRADNRTVLVDGAVAAEFPSTSLEADELLAHFGLLAHPDPRRVLLVDALPGGLLVEVLKHPVTSASVVTLDRTAFAAAATAGGRSVGRLLADPRVHARFGDPLALLRGDTTGYDCIIVPAGVPRSLAANRLATLEFYQACRHRLAAGGVLAVRGPGLPVAGRYAAAGLDVRRATLGSVFSAVQLIPADPSILLAAAGPVLPLTPESAAARLSARGIATYTVAAQLPLLATRPGPAPPGALPVNSTTRPSELFTSLLAGLARTSPRLARSWLWFARQARPLLVVAAVLLLVLFLLARRSRRDATHAAVLTSGLAGSGIALLNLFALQARSGAAYSGVVLLFAAFTAGNAAGALLGNRTPGRSTHGLFISAEAGLAFLALLLAPAARSAPAVAFPSVALFAGACLGLQFALAGRDAPSLAPARTTGRLAALDLAGGLIGALLFPVLLVPAFGLAAAGAGIAAAKLVTALALTVAPARV